MSYFISDVKKIYKSKMVQLTLLLMGIIAVADPLFVRFVYGRHPGFFEQIGNTLKNAWDTAVDAVTGFFGSLFRW